MFGLFNNPSVTPSFEAEPAFSDLPAIRDPNVRGSQLTDYDFQTMREYPFVAAFMSQYPLTRLDTNQLSLAFIDAKQQLTDDATFNRDAAPTDQQIMDAAWEKALFDHNMEVAERADLASLDRNHADDLRMVEIRSAIEDNNLIGMVSGVVKSHPFLAGVFSQLVTNRLNQT